MLELPKLSRSSTASQVSGNLLCHSTTRADDFLHHNHLPYEIIQHHFRSNLQIEALLRFRTDHFYETPDVYFKLYITENWRRKSNKTLRRLLCLPITQCVSYGLRMRSVVQPISGECDYLRVSLSVPVCICLSFSVYVRVWKYKKVILVILIIFLEIVSCNFTHLGKF